MGGERRTFWIGYTVECCYSIQYRTEERFALPFFSTISGFPEKRRGTYRTTSLASCTSGNKSLVNLANWVINSYTCAVIGSASVVGTEVDAVVTLSSMEDAAASRVWRFRSSSV